MVLANDARRIVVVSLSFAAIIACSDERPMPTQTPPNHASANLTSTEPRRPRSDEADFLAISHDVPGYAGHFISKAGVLTAFVTDPSRFGVARAALSEQVAAGRIRMGNGRRSAPIEVRRADYSYQQLSDWRDIVSDYVLGAVPGVVSSDLDEEHNRVTIGVIPGQEAAATKAVNALLTERGIPTTALRVITQERMQKTTARAPLMKWPRTVGSCCDALAGGMRIRWATAANAIRGGCTIGLTANLGAAGMGFITASHCSMTFWNVDATNYFFENAILEGHELYDRPSSPCSWPCGVSRYSDANLVVHTGVRPLYVGRILRPAARVYGSGTDTTIDNTKPYLYVAAAGESITAGSTVDFIGATSGWVYGRVLQTCTDFYDDFPVSWGNRTQCSYKTDMEARAGDSGGPVFYYDGEDGVRAIGIMFAISGSSDSWFSGWAHVYEDNTSGPTVKAFTVTSDITMSGTPTISGTFRGGLPSLSWSPVSVSGTTNPTRYIISRASWDAVSQAYIDNGPLTTTTSTSWTDRSPLIATDTYVGVSYPGTCRYSLVAFSIRAYNQGASTEIGTVYFRGGFNPSDCISHRALNR